MFYVQCSARRRLPACSTSPRCPAPTPSRTVVMRPDAKAVVTTICLAWANACRPLVARLSAPWAACSRIILQRHHAFRFTCPHAAVRAPSCSPLCFAGLLAFSCVQQICTTLVLTTLLFFLALFPHALAIVFHCAARFRATLYLAATRFCRTALRAALCCSPARTVRNFWCA